MDVQVEETSEFARKLSVVVPAPDVDKAYNAVVRSLQKKAQLPGFRPGKAPLEMVEKHYGGNLQSEVIDRLVDSTFAMALRERSLIPVGRPSLLPGAITRGGPFSYTVEFEVQPEVKLKTHKGLKAPKVDGQVSDTEVNEHLEMMRKQAAKLVPVLIRDTVEDGDTVLVDYEGTMGGVAFEGGSAKDALMEVGDTRYLPQLTLGLKGAKVPGERHVQVDFPADYSATELAGKPATFRVTLKELKRKELPALDDEFAKDVGEESLENLRKNVQEGLGRRKLREAEGEQRRKLLEALVEANPIGVSPTMVEEQSVRMVSNAHERLQQYTGQRIQLSEEDVKNLMAENKPEAEFVVRSSLLLMAVAKEAQIKVDDAEINAEIETIAKGAGDQAQRVIAAYQDENRRSNLGYRLLEDKTVKYLLEHAEIA